MERKKTYLTTIYGLVQGVGFRPFVFRLANEFGLKGWVNNTNENVQVSVTADPDTHERFIELIREKAPPASSIESIEFHETETEEYPDFRIIESTNHSEAITEISPDIAVCEDCLRDMKSQPSRIDYPFLNCTNCGPRFTIVRELPYDRARTTMKAFKMCGTCRQEYENVHDRRFHAQPTACSICGPVYTLVKGEERITGIEQVLGRTAAVIEKGGIVAIKGLGGFFLACDAQNEESVRRLRNSKHREGKPFAVMFRGLEAAGEFCRLSEAEKGMLLSWRRPIVILRQTKPLAPAVSNGFPTIGAMLPYMPFHHLLFEKVNCPAIVLTSGNLAEEPILIGNEEAEKVLGPISDAILHFNRDIHNRTDDSVGMVINGRPRLIRRSRGYVPSPIRLDMETEGIFAAGAELVNCFCLGKGNQAILSQHIGDLKNFETYAFYRETFKRFSKTFRLEPGLVVHDMHPDYLSTQFAEKLELPSIVVQHHHAHIASVMAEHRLDEKVIGVSFDGTGLGDDGHIWGSEFLICDLAGYERVTHLDYMPMPGGDRAVREPWRMALSYLFSAYGRKLLKLDLPMLNGKRSSDLEVLLTAVEKGINSPLSSGAGRLFDAVAALLGICTESMFHAEAPMRLESIARFSSRDPYPYTVKHTIDVDVMIRSIVDDLLGGKDPGEISGRFHYTMADIIIENVVLTGELSGIQKVALSGGSFQNRILSELVETGLQEKGFEVYMPLKVPANDGGIALGQLAIAARLRSEGLL